MSTKAELRERIAELEAEAARLKEENEHWRQFWYERQGHSAADYLSKFGPPVQNP